MRNYLFHLTTALAACTGAILACGTTYADPDDARPDSSNADGPHAEPSSIPAGAVMYFDLQNCPEGWSELSSAQGRVVVGRPAGGALGATIGTALPDQGERRIDRIPAHSHVVDPPAFATADAGGHTHTTTVSTAAAHTHDGTTDAAGAHTHNIDTGNGGGTQSIAQFAGTETDGAITDFATASAGSHTHTFTTGSAGAHTHTVTLATAGAHNHAVDQPAFMSSATGDASVDVTMPYVQLLACRKS